MNILIGIAIGWITMGIGVLAFLEWQNRKLFEDKPYVKENKILTDRIMEGLKGKFINKKIP